MHKGWGRHCSLSHMPTPASTGNREGSHHSQLTCPCHHLLLLSFTWATCSSQSPPNGLIYSSYYPTPSCLGCLLVPIATLAPSFLMGFCAPATFGEIPVGRTHAMVGLKTQLSPRGCVTKEEELKSLLMVLRIVE